MKFSQCMSFCLTKRRLTAEEVNKWSRGNKVKCRRTAVCCRGSRIQCCTVAPWLMSVVSAPLDTRLLLCGLIQPHAIKQKSHRMQGQSGEGRLGLESPLFSPLVSHLLPGSVECTHCWAGTQARNTHITESPRGLRCLEVNRIIWSCSVLTLRQLRFHNRGALFPHNLFFSSVMVSIHLPVTTSCRLSFLQWSLQRTPVSAQVDPSETLTHHKDWQNWQRGQRSVSKEAPPPPFAWSEKQ